MRRGVGLRFLNSLQFYKHFPIMYWFGIFGFDNAAPATRHLVFSDVEEALHTHRLGEAPSMQTRLKEACQSSWGLSRRTVNFGLYGAVGFAYREEPHLLDRSVELWLENQWGKGYKGSGEKWAPVRPMTIYSNVGNIISSIDIDLVRIWSGSRPYIEIEVPEYFGSV